jgi:hypothetical protein
MFVVFDRAPETCAVFDTAAQAERTLTFMAQTGAQGCTLHG